MVEKADNPTKAKSQKPDDQNKTTMERVDKQTITRDSDGDAKYDTDSFTKATVEPTKEG